MQTITERPARVAGAISRQLATQERRAAKARQRVQKLREKASAEIERLIAFMDETDGYTLSEMELDDAEPTNEVIQLAGQRLEGNEDDEPSFCGITACGMGMPGNGTGRESVDLEGDYGGKEADMEYSLGWTTSGQHGADMDLEDEHDGCEPDADAEPSLGWTASMSQGQGAWGGDSDKEADASYLTKEAHQRYRAFDRYSKERCATDGRHIDADRGFRAGSRRLLNLSTRQRAAIAPRLNRDDVSA